MILRHAAITKTQVHCYLELLLIKKRLIVFVWFDSVEVMSFLGNIQQYHTNTQK